MSLDDVMQSVRLLYEAQFALEFPMWKRFNVLFIFVVALEICLRLTNNSFITSVNHHLG